MLFRSYDLIVGKPQLGIGEKYNDNIIKDILNMLQLDDITFENIKMFINHKYKI